MGIHRFPPPGEEAQEPPRSRLKLLRIGASCLRRRCVLAVVWLALAETVGPERPVFSFQFISGAGA
eukprot:12046607-Alexandrium_andersonii.AAC.1